MFRHMRYQRCNEEIRTLLFAILTCVNLTLGRVIKLCHLCFLLLHELKQMAWTILFLCRKIYIQKYTVAEDDLATFGTGIVTVGIRIFLIIQPARITRKNISIICLGQYLELSY